MINCGCTCLITISRLWTWATFKIQTNSCRLTLVLGPWAITFCEWHSLKNCSTFYLFSRLLFFWNLTLCWGRRACLPPLINWTSQINISRLFFKHSWQTAKKVEMQSSNQWISLIFKGENQRRESNIEFFIIFKSK